MDLTSGLSSIKLVSGPRNRTREIKFQRTAQECQCFLLYGQRYACLRAEAAELSPMAMWRNDRSFTLGRGLNPVLEVCDQARQQLHATNELYSEYWS